jgi:phosphoribosyl-AMP cyclohydrolase
MEPIFRRKLLYVSKKTGKLKILKCIIAIIVDNETGVNLIPAFMNEEAWLKTKETEYVYLWSTTDDELWFKGERSGNKLQVISWKLNCDRTAIEIRVKILGKGVACHTGQKSCFHNEAS